MAKKEKDIETQALKKSLTEKGKEIASKAKETRLAEDKVNQERYKKFKEDVALNAEAETAYNKYNTNQSLLKKAYNEAVKNKDYGAAFNIERISERESAGVPFEQGARREYFKKQMPTIKKQAIERETEKRKLNADYLAKIESDRLLNKRYNERMIASNPDATSNTGNAFYGGSFNRL